MPKSQEYRNGSVSALTIADLFHSIVLS